ncbi:polyribonucleotide nucleotidyltransferase [Deltaproteobacteria bacterium TL4]
MEIVETEFGGAKISFETGRMAKQANGSVVVRYGDTMVLVAATAEKGCGEGASFFPLSVHYIQKMYAAGRIPGGFFKREGRLSDSETLISRFIDRPLRPMFDSNYLAETLVTATVLSYDLTNAPDVAAMAGASAALAISDIPFYTPIAGVRVGLIDGQFIANPTIAELEISELDIFMAASKSAILMVEGEAKEVSEAVMLDAILFGHEQVKPVIAIQEELVKRCGKAKRQVPAPEVNVALKAKVEDLVLPKVKEALQIKDKLERYSQLDTLVSDVIVKITEEQSDVSPEEIKELVGDLKKREMRSKILNDGVRIDGRTVKEIRQITCETDVLPRTHGSALFTRGETQALVVATLGSRDDEQMIDSLTGVSYKNFILHYNFPSFCVGEARAPRNPGRREIGHGFLAERALSKVLPQKVEFPYTIRLVSEILESNGSSSMASVCGGSLAMMDAGIPVSKASAGIAMGLIAEGDKTAILSDILGDEDHLGDMDFKVVGTMEGITALQMDIKIEGLSKETIVQALEQAREGRLHILGIMNQHLNAPRIGLSRHAPRFVTHKIPKDKIGDVIGPGGKIIKGIVEKTGVKINIDDDGVVNISSRDHEAVDAALAIVQGLTRDVEIGATYTGPVKRVVEFGAFVELFPGTEGLVHISNLTEGRVKNVTDVVKEGDIITVKAMGLDRRGKLQLSMKDV